MPHPHRASAASGRWSMGLKLSQHSDSRVCRSLQMRFFGSVSRFSAPLPAGSVGAKPLLSRDSPPETRRGVPRCRGCVPFLNWVREPQAIGFVELFFSMPLPKRGGQGVTTTTHKHFKTMPVGRGPDALGKRKGVDDMSVPQLRAEVLLGRRRDNPQPHVQLQPRRFPPMFPATEADTRASAAAAPLGTFIFSVARARALPSTPISLLRLLCRSSTSWRWCTCVCMPSYVFCFVCSVT